MSNVIKCLFYVTMKLLSRLPIIPCKHSRTKHIEIRHHFIRDHVARGDIELAYVPTKDQLADIFMKPLDDARFCYLSNELNIIDSGK